MRTIFIISIICLIATACEQKPVEQSTSKLSRLYEELILASIDSANLEPNFLKTTLDSMHLSKSEFDIILKQAQETPELWIGTLDSLLKKLNAKEGQDQQSKKRPLFQNKTPVSLPTTDWTVSPHFKIWVTQEFIFFIVLFQNGTRFAEEVCVLRLMETRMFRGSNWFTYPKFSI